LTFINNNYAKDKLYSFLNAGIITSSTVIIQAYPAKPHNYTWCRYCSGKGRIIRFQFFEVFKILHPESFFHWCKQTIRTKWIAFDEDTWNIHKHNLIAAAPSPRRQNLLSENNYMEMAAKAKTSRLLCDCPGAEPGKINIDVSAHLSGCWIRKKLLARRYTIDTCVTPEGFKDGYSLGVAITN
jgi:hypothetical protein